MESFIDKVIGISQLIVDDILFASPSGVALNIAKCKRKVRRPGGCDV